MTATPPLLALCLFIAACGSTESSTDVPTSSSRVTSPSSATAQTSARVAPRDKTDPLPSRIDFAKAMSGVKPGMDADEVRKLVGPPDDVRTAADPGGIPAARVKEVWRYGTSGHLSFATLGSILMGTTDRVEYVFGGDGSPQATDLGEARLRDILRVVDRVPSYNAMGDPLALIRAVNTLQPLGKDEALAVLGEYLRVASDFDDPAREGVFLVLRTLLDPPADTGVFPHMAVGQPNVPFPKNDKDAPRFPIIIVDDIPFNAVTGYTLAGMAEPPEMHLAWMKDHATTMRAKLLTPTNTPIDSLRTIVGSGAAPFLSKLGMRDVDRITFMAQGARLLEHVVPGAFNTSLRPDDAWKVFESERAVLVEWSPADNDYKLKAK